MTLLVSRHHPDDPARTFDDLTVIDSVLGEPAAVDAWSPGALPADARVLLVGSSGGHLAQLRALAPLWTRSQRHWVTFDTPDALSLLEDESVTYAFHPTTRNVPNLMRNTAQARQVMRQVRPDVVVSTGAAVAYPYFLLARAAGIPRVFLEVYDRVDSRTLTGRLCRRHASVFAVQWPEQQPLYRGSVVVGPVL